MYRLFCGYRLTTSDTCLYPNTMKQLQDKGIMTLGGGMQPPMYSRNHMSSFLHKPFYIFGIKNKKYGKGSKNEIKINTIQWSNLTFKDRCLIKKPKGYEIAYRYMPSLKELGWGNVYPNYSKKELKSYKPCKINMTRSRSRSKKSKYAENNPVITITIGDAAENQTGMQMIGQNTSKRSGI